MDEPYNQAFAITAVFLAFSRRCAMMLRNSRCMALKQCNTADKSPQESALPTAKL